MKARIEVADDRLTARSETISWSSGIVLIGFLAAWDAVAGRGLLEAWGERSWDLALRPAIAIALATLILGGFALFSFGHQRLSLSADGLENAWVVIRPIRRRSIPVTDIRSIDVLTRGSDESSVTYLSIRTTKREVKWTLLGGLDDRQSLRGKLRTLLRNLKRGGAKRSSSR